MQEKFYISQISEANELKTNMLYNEKHVHTFINGMAILICNGRIYMLLLVFLSIKVVGHMKASLSTSCIRLFKNIRTIILIWTDQDFQERQFWSRTKINADQLSSDSHRIISLVFPPNNASRQTRLSRIQFKRNRVQPILVRHLDPCIIWSLAAGSTGYHYACSSTIPYFERSGWVADQLRRLPNSVSSPPPPPPNHQEQYRIQGITRYR